MAQGLAKPRSSKGFQKNLVFEWWIYYWISLTLKRPEGVKKGPPIGNGGFGHMNILKYLLGRVVKKEELKRESEMFLSGAWTQDYFQRANEIFPLAGGEITIVERTEWDVLVRGWGTRLFQMSKWDFLIRGLVMKRKFETRYSHQGVGVGVMWF